MATGRFCRASIVMAVGGALATLGWAGAAGAVTGGHVAGYVATAGSGTQKGSVTFVVPKITCSGVRSGDAQAVAAGADLITSTGDTGAAIGLVCTSPTPSYVSVLQINGSGVGTPLTIKPGNKVTLTVSEGSAKSSVKIVDGAQHETVTGSGGSPTSDEVGDLAVNCGASGCSPVPKLKSTTDFSSASIDGKNLTKAGATRENLVDLAGAVEIKSSALVGSDSFKATWVSSCGVGPGGC
jgi:hypothetical protein